MLAVLYILTSVFIGDRVCRRFFSPKSLPHRLAAGLLIGLLICSWVSYLLALAFCRTQNPMLYGSVVFFLLAAAALVHERRKHGSLRALIPTGAADRFDLAFAGLFAAISCWLMFGTFGVSTENLKIAAFLTNDFGPNLSLVQSFAVGRNFPTEYPHFIGEPIRYHFLFWFQAGNLQFLGLNIAWALNLLSALTLTAMLLMIDAFGRKVFDSKATGRIAAILFFFHGSLAFIPFLLSKGGPGEMLSAIVGATEFLRSIYTYTGEQWGIWSMGTFLAQRHLLAATGIFLVVLLGVVERIRQISTEPGPEPITPYLLGGVILGLMPTWNGAVFVAGFGVVGSLMFVFRPRRSILVLLMTAAAVAVPQILLLRSSGARGFFGLFRWGYVVEPATILNVLEYFSFTFGIKLLLALIAVVLLQAFHRKVFLAAFSLIILTFCTQLSTEVMNNHKFLNVWLVLINGYAAYTLVRLAKVSYVGPPLAVILFVFVAVGGTIELFRVRNVDIVHVPYGSGQLYEWLDSSTEPRDIFLSNTFVSHPILLSGRRIYYGWAYFGWSMGYPTGERDLTYNKMLTEKDPKVLLDLLRANNIKYVAFDDGLRTGHHLSSNLNERVFAANFEKVFSDAEQKYGSIAIYRVP